MNENQRQEKKTECRVKNSCSWQFSR